MASHQPNDDQQKFFELKRYGYTPLLPSALQNHPVPAVPTDPGALFMESCIARGIMSFVGGGVLGGGVGVLIGGYNSITPPIPVPGQPTPPRVPFKQLMHETGQGLKTSAKYWGKSFALVGGVYSSIDCVIERARGKRDLKNSLVSGFLAGAILAGRQGPLAMFTGAVGFAAFSLLIDSVLDH